MCRPESNIVLNIQQQKNIQQENMEPETVNLEEEIRNLSQLTQDDDSATSQERKRFMEEVNPHPPSDHFVVHTKDGVAFVHKQNWPRLLLEEEKSGDKEKLSIKQGSGSEELEVDTILELMDNEEVEEIRRGEEGHSDISDEEMHQCYLDKVASDSGVFFENGKVEEILTAMKAEEMVQKWQLLLRGKEKEQLHWRMEQLKTWTTKFQQESRRDDGSGSDAKLGWMDMDTTGGAKSGNNAEKLESAVQGCRSRKARWVAKGARKTSLITSNADMGDAANNTVAVDGIRMVLWE
ncbi:hypothetical protein PR202_ga16675 [Eleusine coracana subsp. coracana]|uniref:Uncharacterized protein n=1 Tax=Eleusine coracana subsp. coracana TaxID=191504 RepID=A0AAV5CM29_ELECO|nr:hypothetical protein PR202_ga16675 [Eleusine coracana subsp. coracana]